MKIEEFYKHIDNGERWFNNGSKRNRYVVGIAGVMVMYKSKPSSNQTVGVWPSAFAKWAKGVGQVLPTGHQSTE